MIQDRKLFRIGMWSGAYDTIKPEDDDVNNHRLSEPIRTRTEATKRLDELATKYPDHRWALWESTEVVAMVRDPIIRTATVEEEESVW